MIGGVDLVMEESRCDTWLSRLQAYSSSWRVWSSCPPRRRRSRRRHPRTSWGRPDLGGVWEYKTRTQLSRPEHYGDREFLTEEEAARIEEQERARLQEMADRPAQRTVAIPTAGDRPGRWLDQPDHPSLQGQTGSYNIFWFDWGTSAVKTRRTSLIVDPPNGRMPGMTEAGRERARIMGARSSFSDTVDTAESHLDFSNSDRCLMSGNAGPPMLPGVYNNNMQLFQTPNHVAIINEMIHTVRIIPLDGQPGLTPEIRQFTGDGRGHWEGDTLVVETSNFHNDDLHTTWRNTSGNRTLVERFTRTDADTLPLRVHGDGSGHLGAAVVGRAADAAERAADLRVRVPRGQLRAAEHPARQPQGGGGRGGGTVIRHSQEFAP